MTGSDKSRKSIQICPRLCISLLVGSDHPLPRKINANRASNNEPDVLDYLGERNPILHHKFTYGSLFHKRPARSRASFPTGLGAGKLNLSVPPRSSRNSWL